MAIQVGIDLGSVSVKAALFSRDSADAPFFERQGASPVFQSVRRVADPRGGDCWLATTRYARIAGSPLAQARTLLDTLLALVEPAALGGLTATGSGSALLKNEFGIDRQNEFRALAKAVELLLPRVRTLFEMGGENSKYVLFHRDPDGPRLGIADYGTNGDCAAGTGGFLDQQAGRLQFKVEEIGDIVLATGRAAQIAGRCSVFAKSDMIHAQQKGFTPEEILKGLCDAVARNFKSAITRGKKLVPEVAFVGGVAANQGVVQALETAFGWKIGTLVVPDDHTSFGAIGSAILADEAFRADRRSPTPVSLTSRPSEGQQFPASPPLSMDNVVLLRERMTVVPAGAITARRDAYLGIDIGSVSTNLVVIDAGRNVLKEIYLRTNARPIEAVSIGLREIECDLGDRIRVRGVGTTGSGRELIGELVGADTVNDEITAHKTGAAFIDSTILGLGVDTIFEIGGQDSKFISLEQGIVVDFAMNEACAAGTGSFPEERAKELGIRIEEQFAQVALSSSRPVRLGERCTVFMERDVNSYLQRGAELDGSSRARLLRGDELHQPGSSREEDRRGDLLPGRNCLQRRGGGGLQFHPWEAGHRPALQRGDRRPGGRAAGAAEDDRPGRAKRLPWLRPRQGELRHLRVHLQGLHELLPDAAVHDRGGADLLGRQVLGALPQGGQERARAGHRQPD
jgi:predicted CoA-substrate-specific enzyme activase